MAAPAGGVVALPIAANGGPIEHGFDAAPFAITSVSPARCFSIPLRNQVDALVVPDKSHLRNPASGVFWGIPVRGQSDGLSTERPK